MKMTDGEKLIAIMLADLSKHLKTQGEIDPDFVQETIWSDRLWGFHWMYSGIPFERDEDPSEVSQTANFLDMWYFIEISYDQLDSEEQKRVDAEISPHTIRFPGFDGNHEDHMGIARYIVEHLHRFDHFKGRNLNSHMSSVPRYQRMYELFKPMRDAIPSNLLSADQIIRLIKAR